MKKALLVFTILFSCLYCNAQGWEWGRSGGTVDGWINKADRNNNIYTGGIWGGTSVTIGSYTFHNYTAGPNNVETLIAKYDSSGNLLWSCASTLGQAWPMDIVADDAGNAYLYGCFWTDSLILDSQLIINTQIDSCPNCTYSTGCYFIIKFDSNGHVVWSRTGVNLSSGDGDIAIDGAANLYISGSFKSAFAAIGPDTLYNTFYNRGEMFLAKYDSSGHALWAKRFGGIFNEYAGQVAIGTDNKVYMSGVFNSTNISFGATTLHYQTSMPLDSIGNTFLAKFDTSGNAIWAKSGVGSAIGYGMDIDYDNNIYVGGEVYDTSYASFDLDTLKGPTIKWAGFLTKYDSAGNVKWARGIYNGSTSLAPVQSANRIYGIVTDACGNVWVSSRMAGDTAGVYLDSTTVLHIPSGSVDPMFLAGYDPNGNVFQYLAMKSGGDDQSRLAIDNGQNIYLCDDIENTWLIFGNDSIHSQGGETMFLAKYKANVCLPDGIGKEVNACHNSITLFPNPATNNLTIQYSSINKATAGIYDITGRLMGSYPLTGSTTTISVQNLPPGIYQCRINDDKHDVLTKKVVVMH